MHCGSVRRTPPETPNSKIFKTLFAPVQTEGYSELFMLIL